MRTRIGVALAVFAVGCGATEPQEAPSTEFSSIELPPQSCDVSVVDLQGMEFQDVLAAQTCTGLMNRNPGVIGAAFTIQTGQQDWDWLSTMQSQSSWIRSVRNVTYPDFVQRCMASNVTAGYIRYQYSTQHLIIPQLVTVAGVVSAVPLEDGSPYTKNASIAFDARAVFGTNSTLREATQYIYDHFVDNTTTMAMMDPGFTGADKNPFAPNLTHSPNARLIDFIVQQRLFNFYMVEACIPLTDDHALMDTIAASNPWPRPIPVWGYDNTFPILGGDFFEAETFCSSQHNMGQIASDSVDNLSFFTLDAPITEPMPQNPTHVPTYNSSKTYLAITVGDGDNLSFMQGGRRTWMQQRVAKCKQDPSYNGCFPLLWSASPHMLQHAPAWAKWYYGEARATGNDYFVLPPSGHLYAYPSIMSPEDYASFVKQTEEDARLMSTNSAVAWEFALSWGKAIDEYFPQYDEGQIVQSFFAVNVPFMLPVLPFLGGKEFFKVLGNHSRVVLFKPREWRGTDKSRSPPLGQGSYLTAQEMAAEVNGYPGGTVTQIYVTSDGGANLDTIYSLVPLLGEHVQLVDHEALAVMALASHGEKRGRGGGG